MLAQYDATHVKLVQLRVDREKLQAAIANDPANADAYRRALVDVNGQIDKLGTASKSAARGLTEQGRAAKQLQSAYDNASEGMAKQIQLYDETGHAAEIRYQIERGELQGVGLARANNLLQMAQEIDKLDAQKQAVQALFPEFERLAQAKQLQDSVAALPADMQGFGQRRAGQMIAETATAGLPAMQGLDPQYNGAFGEASRLEDDKAKYQAEYESRLAAFQEYAQQHQDQKATADQAIEALEADHQKRMVAYEDQTAKARRQGYEELYGSLTDVVGAFAGRQSGIYKGLFAAEKAYHFASVLMSSTDAIAKAWASAPFPANLPAVATTVVKTGVLSSAVDSVSLAGQAHDGSTSLPRTGTYYMEGGERVVDRAANQDLTRYLQRNNSTTNNTQSGVFSPTINVTVKGQPGMSDEESNRQGQDVAAHIKRVIHGELVDQMRSGGLLSGVKRPA